MKGAGGEIPSTCAFVAYVGQAQACARLALTSPVLLHQSSTISAPIFPTSLARSLGQAKDDASVTRGTC